MHRENARQALQIRLSAIHAAQEDRHQRRVPIMRVKNQVAFAEASRDFDRRGGKQREAAMVVRVIAARITIDAGTVERWIVLEEQGLRVFVSSQAPAAHFFVRATTLDRKWIAQGLELAGMFPRFSVQRQHDVGLHATRGLIVREARDRLAKSARAGVRPQLRGQVEDPSLQKPPVVRVAARLEVLPRQLRGRSSWSRSFAAFAEW